MNDGRDKRDQAPRPADGGVDVTLIDEMLRMAPGERLRQNDRMAALAVKLREAFVARDLRWPSRGS